MLRVCIRTVKANTRNFCVSCGDVLFGCCGSQLYWLRTPRRSFSFSVSFSRSSPRLCSELSLSLGRRRNCPHKCSTGLATIFRGVGARLHGSRFLTGQHVKNKTIAWTGCTYFMHHLSRCHFLVHPSIMGIRRILATAQHVCEIVHHDDPQGLSLQSLDCLVGDVAVKDFASGPPIFMSLYFPPNVPLWECCWWLFRPKRCSHSR